MMKKMIIPMLAVILAVSASAFSVAPADLNNTQYDWRVFEEGMPTSTFLDNLTEAQVLDQYPDCNQGSVTCFQAHNKDNRGIAYAIYLKKP